ncbi:MAG: hypothetical protein ACFCGT_12570 [Sandaracinaceae bacterium]
MSDQRRRRRSSKEPAEPGPLRRKPSERKRLPAHLEAFASGDDDAIWRRPAPRQRLRDPRAVILIPGVANRDARSVFEARVRRIEKARADEDRAALALELADARRLGIWRGHSIVGWEVFVEDVLGLDLAEADALAAEGAAQLGTDGSEAPGPAAEAVVAIALRAEAGLLEAHPDAAARLRGPAGDEVLRLELPAAVAPEALSSVGRRAHPMAREQSEAPQVVVDRPPGVPRLREWIDRDRPPPKD